MEEEKEEDKNVNFSCRLRSEKGKRFGKKSKKKFIKNFYFNNFPCLLISSSLSSFSYNFFPTPPPLLNSVIILENAVSFVYLPN